MLKNSLISIILMNDQNVYATHAKIFNFQKKVLSRTKNSLNTKTQNILIATSTNSTIIFSNFSKQIENS